MNNCILFKNINLFDSNEKVDYSLIYSDDLNDVLKVVTVILKMWDLGFGKNDMRDQIV